MQGGWWETRKTTDVLARWGSSSGKRRAVKSRSAPGDVPPTLHAVVTPPAGRQCQSAAPPLGTIVPPALGNGQQWSYTEKATNNKAQHDVTGPEGGSGGKTIVQLRRRLCFPPLTMSDNTPGACIRDATERPRFGGSWQRTRGWVILSQCMAGGRAWYPSHLRPWLLDLLLWWSAHAGRGDEGAPPRRSYILTR